MLEINLPTRLRPPVIASFTGPESKNLNDLILIRSPLARERFAVPSADARISRVLLKPHRLPNAGHSRC